MTTYLCAHPSHRRGSDPGAVDVTAQVRTERAMLPRPQAYLAIVEDVVDAVMRLGDVPDRRERIEHVLSGDAEPQDLPVVLMSRRSVERLPGRYELDGLRAEEAEVERIVTRVGPSSVPTVAAADDVVVIEDAPATGPGAVSGGTAPTATLTRQEQRAPIVVPQGVFPFGELAANLAIADATEAALIDAIRSTPVHDGRTGSADPWRVVITCPRPEGSPPAHHDVLFTGAGGREAAVAYGTPVDAWDAEVEAAALLDMAPGAETSRVERRLWMLLGGEALVLVAMLLFGWISGGLALAVRETTGWLGLSLVLAGTAIAFAAAPSFAIRDRAANMNDTLWLEHLYRARVDLYRVAAAISATLFAFAVLVAVIPPLFLETRPLPAATVTFDTSPSSITATVRVAATGVGAGDALNVTMREYRSGADPEGVLVGHVTRHGSPSGTISFSETFALDANASYLSVLVSDGRSPDTACNPSLTGAPGCTVLAVPSSTPTITRLTAFVPPATVVPVNPSPVVPTPPPASPSVAVPPGIAGSPSPTPPSP